MTFLLVLKIGIHPVIAATSSYFGMSSRIISTDKFLPHATKTSNSSCTSKSLSYDFFFTARGPPFWDETGEDLFWNSERYETR